MCTSAYSARTVYAVGNLVSSQLYILCGILKTFFKHIVVAKHHSPSDVTALTYESDTDDCKVCLGCLW